VAHAPTLDPVSSFGPQSPASGMWRRTIAFFSLALATLPAGAEERNASAASKGAPTEIEVRGKQRSPAEGPRDPSLPASFVKKAEMAAPGLDAGDVLRTEVGLTITETGGLGAAQTASVRGATAAETPVYLAGVRLNDDVGGAADLSTVPLFLIDRVEVYRGNAPLEADRLSIGGAIFFEPKRAERTEAGLGVLAGSYGTLGAHAYASGGDSERALLLGARLEGADNDYPFADDAGTRFVAGDDGTARLTNAAASLADLWLIGRTRVGDGSVELIANRIEREQGAPRLAQLRTRAASIRTERNLAALKGRAPLGERGFVDTRTVLLRGGSVLDDPLYELALGTNRLEFAGERVEQHVSPRIEPFHGLVLRLALDAESERLRRFGDVMADAAPELDVRRVSLRSGLGAEVSLGDALTLRPLLSLECHDTTSGSGMSCDSFEPTGRLSALASFSELALFASAGRYARLPTLGELHGISVAVHGNPRLDSETGVTLDAGARYTRRLADQVSPLFVALSAYTRSASELVTFVRSGAGYVVPINVGAARVSGLELEAGAGFGRYFSAEVALTAIDARDRSEGRLERNDILPFQSRLVAAPSLRASTREVFRAGRGSLGARLLYQSNRFVDRAGLAVVPEQYDFDADLALESHDEALALRLRVANVLDRARWDVVGFPLPGRSVFASAEARL
jgi:vitamin B12 transporter